MSLFFVAFNYTIQEINNTYEDLKNKRDKSKKELKKIESEIKEILSKEYELWTNDQALEIVKVKYSILFENLNITREVFNQYDNKIIGIEGIKASKRLNEQVKKVSSIYKIKQKSEAKLITIIGLCLGITLGIMSAFMKEVYVEFKKEVKSQ